MALRHALRVVAALVSLAAASSAGAGEERTTTPVTRSQPPSIRFEANRGQAAADVEFLARNEAWTLLLSRAGATLRSTGPDAASPALRMTFEQANRTAPLSGEAPRAERVYYADSQATRLQPGATFDRVRQSNLYPGVDLLYYVHDRQLEFDLLVAPHVEPARIRLAFSGASAMSLRPDGELAFRVAGDEIRLRKPVIYQERDGVRTPVTGGYRILDAKSQIVGFTLGPYDPALPLVIDPTIVFATYRGGSDHDTPRAVKANALGEVYLFADTRDPASLPANHRVVHEPLAPPQPGFNQCYLTKIARDGQSALYTVIFEGAQCQAMDIAYDASSGATKVHLQVGTSRHYQRTITESPTGDLSIAPLQGAYDACAIGGCGPVDWMRADSSGNVYFVMLYTPAGITPPAFVYELRKIDREGRLVGSRRLIEPPLYTEDGQNYVWDQVTGVDIDNGGLVYVVGYGASPGIITPTANALQPARPSGNVCADPLNGPCFDAFVLKVDTTADFAISYASYLGGAHDDRAFAVAVDPDISSRVVITGTSRSPNFPVTQGSYYPITPSPSGEAPAFVAKLDLAAAPANQLVFGTFLGPGTSTPNALAILPGGAPAIGGITWSPPQFPLVAPVYPSRPSGPLPFVSVLSSDGAGMLFSSYLDTTDGAASFVSALASNGSSTLYTALSTDDPALATPSALQTAPTGQHDALVQAIDVSDILADNASPAVTISPAVIRVTPLSPTVGAIAPLVCGRLFTCTLDDADGDLLTALAWFGPDGYRRAAAPGVLPAPAGRPGIVPSDFVTLGFGTHTFTLVARDERGAVGSGTLQIEVAPHNTEIGTDQRVTLTDPRYVADEWRALGAEHPITVTFAEVTAPGLTWLEPVATPAPPPDGMQAGSPPYQYDLLSTASFAGVVRVCVDVRGMSHARSNEALLIHRFDQGVWRPLDNHDVANEGLCADAPALGRFAIFYPQVAETAITAVAGTGSAENALDGPGGDPHDDFFERVAATQSTLTRPGRLARDNAGRVYVADNGVTEGARIRRIEPNGVVSTFAQTGTCNGFLPFAVDPLGQFLYCVQASLNGGPHDIVRYDFDSGSVSIVASASDVTALALDAQGALFYADGDIHRVRPDGSTQAIFAFGNRGTALRLLYDDRVLALAFDREGALLAGGETLIRITPGADGVIDGAADESVAWVGGVDRFSFAAPYMGDGLPATRARLNVTYQLIVAADGAVVFTDQTGGIRRIAPGADGLVTGGDDEIVRTIAGYFSSTDSGPSAFATSEYGDFRGVLEDPRAADRFLVSSHQRHVIQRFGIPPSESTGNAADLSVSLSASTPAIVGGTVTIVAHVANLGPAAAAGVSATVSIPAGLSVVSATAPAGTTCTTAAGSVICATPTLPAGQRVDLTIATTATLEAAVAVTAVVASSSVDPRAANDAASVDVTIRQGADLAVAIVAPASGSTVTAGEPFTYEISVTNNGPANATLARLSFDLEIGLEIVRAGLRGGAPCAELYCDIPNLAAGATQIVEIVARPLSAGTLTSSFGVAATALADPTPQNDIVTHTVTSGLVVSERIVVSDAVAVTPSVRLDVAETISVSDEVSFPRTADLSIAVTPTRTLLNLNDALVYNVTVVNHGPMPTAATFTLAPGALVVEQLSLPSLSCTVLIFTGTWTCDLGEIAPGDTMQFTVTGRVTTTGAVTSTFSVAGLLSDEAPADNTTAVSVTVNRPPVVDAGPDRELIGVAPVSALLSAAVSDPDGDPIVLFQWRVDGALFPGGSFVDLPLAYGTHTITVTVIDARGGQAVDTVIIVVRPSFLPPPAWVSAESNAPGQATVSWAPVAGAAEYRVYRGVDPVTFTIPLTQVVIIAPNAQLVATTPNASFVDTGLPPLVRQFYAVTAVSGPAVSAPASAAQTIVRAQPDAAIFGFADMHSHQFANLGFGRSLIHGSASGHIHDALGRCQIVHGVGGLGDVVGNFLTGSVGHDTLGFDPTSFSEFSGWPAHNSRTHQQMHHSVLRRAFDGGQRLMVMHAESNKVLCQMTAHDPQFSCEDMASIEDQIIAAKSLEAQIDNESGGAGRGWYRIAYSGAEARSIINSGRMAVVLGIEVDELFACGRNATCTFDDVRARLDYYHQLGVRHLFPVGHFDNAFGGAAMFNTLYSFGNWATTGSFFAPRECGPEGYRYAPGVSAESAIWLTLRLLLGQPPTLPAFPDPPFVSDCNSRSLTGLGEFLVREMMARGMIIDIDHMSALSANRTLTIAEAAGYPGVVSGHSSPLAALNANKANEGAKSSSQLSRIYALGGLAAVLPNQGDRWTAARPDGVLQYGTAVPNDCGQSSKTYAQTYLAAVDLAGGPATSAVGIGSDFNGLGGQPGPRFGPGRCLGDASPGVQSNRITYPFAIVAPAGVDAGRLLMADTPDRKNGSNVLTPWDFNEDGLAHAGMLPDLIEDLRRVGVPNAYLQPLFRSAEAYVHMWERADGSSTPFVAGTLLIPGLNVVYRAASMTSAPQPVTASFGSISLGGYLVAEPIETPPPAPTSTLFIGPVFDLLTTATYTGPITVCFDGSFAAGDRLMHFESDVWVDITMPADSTLARLCGRSTSLSPFAVVRTANHAPSADAGVYPPIEATSPAGALVALSAAASDPDPGDVLAFEWVAGSRVLGTSASLSTVFPIGRHDVTLTVTDSHGATATSSTLVVVRDTTAPAVSAPARLTIPATQADGARPSTSAALSNWLTAATARDTADPAPALTALVAGAPVTSTTRFPIGTTTVTFTFRDASGNTGTATSSVQVELGTPRLAMTFVGATQTASGRYLVDVSLANTGNGIARQLTMLFVPVVTKGRGVVIVRSAQPVTIGQLDPGASKVVRLELSIPNTAQKVLIVGAGAFLNVKGLPGVFEERVTYEP